MAGDDATSDIARFIEATSLAEVPRGVQELAEHVIADTIAVIIAGSSSEVAPLLHEYLERNPSPGPATIIGWDGTVTPSVAALVNGTLGHALDYDDVVTLYPAHPSAVVVAALLASPEPAPLSGAAFVEAYCIGVEVGAQIGRGIGLGHYNQGWHATGTLAIFSAVAALAKARGLDTLEIRRALGIAASLSSGMQRNFGTMTKPFHTGWAAQGALTAVELATIGWTADERILDDARGYLALYGDEHSDPARIGPALGRPWVFVDPGVALKKYPCCWAVHRLIDAVFELRPDMLPLEEIERIEVHLPPNGLRQLPYARPSTGLEGKFSAHYAAATALVDGAVTLASFTDEAVGRPEVKALYDRIEVTEDPRCAVGDDQTATDAPGEIGFVEVTMQRKGASKTAAVYAPIGSASRPMSWEDIGEKLLDCAAASSMDPAAATALFGQLKRLGSLADVRSLAASIDVPIDALVDGHRAAR